MDETFELESTIGSSEIVLSKSTHPDIIDKFYKIKVHESITELNTDLYKYYNAVHIENGEEYYAIVLEKSNVYTIQWLNDVKNSMSYCIVPPTAYGVTQLSSSGEYNLVIIVKKYNYINNLTQRVLTSDVMSYEEAMQVIIKPIVSLLKFCEKANIEIGNISPNNIFFTDDKKIILKEFYISQPHVFQETYLLAPEITNCMPYGRITNSNEADIYAFGVTLLYALTGNQIWSKYSDQQYDLIRLENGSFNTLVSKVKIEPDLKNLLKGLLHDNPNERWKIKNIVDWINGKAVKALNNDSLDANSPIVFNDTSFQNCRSLAYSMHINWDEAIQFIREERLTKWIQRSLVKNKTTESLNELLVEQATYKYGYQQDRDENLFKIIIALDPNSPMRLKNFACTVLSLPSIVCASIVNKRSDYLEAILKLIIKKFWSFTVEKNPAYDRYIEYFQNIETAIKFYNPSIAGFTVERMLYTLNPNLPCLSNNLNGNFVTNISELLTILDKMAELNPQVILIDKHITGYIAAKLNLRRELKIPSLQNYPQIAQNPAILALSNIFLAHQQVPTLSIANLGNKLAIRLVEVFDEYLHNTRLKNFLKKDLINAGLVGNLGQLINIISDTKLIENDANGYKVACKEVNILNDKIKSLKNRDKVSELGAFLGQRITVLISYLLITGISLILLF